MKFGLRVPSLKRRIAARTSWKRYVRHSMGIKVPRGMGALTNPKKAFYNKIYNKTTIGLDDITKSEAIIMSSSSQHTKGKLSLTTIIIFLVLLVVFFPLALVYLAYVLYKQYKNNNSNGQISSNTQVNTPNDVAVDNKQVNSLNPDRIEGEIGFYHLVDWWMTAFNEIERKHIEEVFSPLGGSGEHTLTKGTIGGSTQSVVSFLTSLAGWFNNPQDRYISIRIIDKANELSNESSGNSKKSGIDRHFALSEKITIYYRDRDKDPQMLEKAISACKEQILIAPEVARLFQIEYPGQPLPSHVGFEQLAIIYDKNNEYQKAIDICLEAKNQGWGGDWDKRIDRYKKEMSNSRQ